MIIIRKISAPDTWPMRHTVMWPDHPFDYIKLERDEIDGLHYGLFDGEALVSVVSLFVDGHSGQFRKFATSLAHQNKGYGSQLLRQLIGECRQLGLKQLWCNARVNKAYFYEKFGLRKTNRTYQKGGHDFVVMEMDLD